MRANKKKNDDRTLEPARFVILFCLIACDCAGWYFIIANALPQPARAYFLDVGQGDSELVIFSNGVKIMTDAGPDNSVMKSLNDVLLPDDTYIDLAVISHPQLDHFNGYNYILEHYRIGAFIYNGRDDSPGVSAWPELLVKIKEKHIPLITLGMGDSIHSGNNEIDILSPDKEFDESAELNDTGLVELVKTPGWKELLTADIGFNVEDLLLANHDDIRVDILKVPHHGSKYSSGDAFLRTVYPRAAVIEVGAHNTYGHPGKETLARLASSTNAKVFRTDRDGTVEIWSEGDTLRISKAKG